MSVKSWGHQAPTGMSEGVSGRALEHGAHRRMELVIEVAPRLDEKIWCHKRGRGCGDERKAAVIASQVMLSVVTGVAGLGRIRRDVSGRLVAVDDLIAAGSVNASRHYILGRAVMMMVGSIHIMVMVGGMRIVGQHRVGGMRLQISKRDSDKCNAKQACDRAARGTSRCEFCYDCPHRPVEVSHAMTNGSGIFAARQDRGRGLPSLFVCLPLGSDRNAAVPPPCFRGWAR